MSDKNKTEQKVVQPGATVPDELQRVANPAGNPAENPAVKSAMPGAGSNAPANPVAVPVNPARESGAQGVDPRTGVPVAGPVNAAGVPVTGLNPVQVGALGANPNVSNPNPVQGGVVPHGNDAAHEADKAKVDAGEEKDEDKDKSDKDEKKESK